MKSRRALQIIVGILSLLVLICMLGAAVCVGLAVWKPADFGFFNGIYQKIIYQINNQVAPKLHMAEIPYLVTILACGLPALLMLIAVCLLFSRNKGKMGKYNAGCILALIGVAILSLFVIVFAGDLTSKFNATAITAMPLEWLVRLVAIGLLALFVLFIGLALGIKVKKATDTVEESEDVSTEATEAIQQQQPTTSQQPFNDYVPHYTSVAEVTNSLYGNSGEIDPAVMDKINKAHKLYEIGAITHEEYMKLVQYYTNKK